MRIAVIPARGGSKRIPRKNIRDFEGKPIIGWSIDAARKAGCFDRVLVSTDDEEIADIARGCGAEVPFMRPAELSDDFTGTIAVMGHAAAACALGPDDLLCAIYATAPFLRPSDLRAGLRALEETGSEYAFSVTTFPFPIQRAVRCTAAGRLEMFDPEQAETRSQDLEESWHDAAQFYWGRARAWSAGTPLFSDAAAPVPLPRHRVQDMDTQEDWDRAVLMFRALVDRAGEA
ncbi:pseudaminic acid cytidylyltransferase [Planctomycetota bacterium]|nr:pseudaminic acid cytidylyltransferase [Planctomycetota bacterium]